MAKQNSAMTLGLILIVALVAAIAWKQGVFDGLGTASVSGSSTTGGNTVLANLQPSVTATAKDQYNGTVLAGSMTLFIDGVKSTGTAGTAFNVPQGGSFEAVFDDGQHYNTRVTGTAPVNGNVPVEMKSYPNGTISSTFYNSAGTAATAQALTSGDEKYVKVLVTSLNDKVFSNPDSDKNPIICFDYNTTEMDTIEVVSGSPAPMPQQAVGTYEECDYAPFKSLADGQEFTIQLLVDADDSTNPVGDATMIIYDQDLKLKTKMPIDSRVFDAESDAGADIGGINPTVTLDFS